MKNKFFWISIFLLLILLTLLLVGLYKKNARHTFHKQITRLIKDFDSNINIGILIKDAQTGKIWYQRNSHRYFMPASNEKLFVAFAALDYLGPRFVYRTRLFAQPSKVENHVLKDNVYIQFAGDPTLSIKQLDHLIHALTQLKIDRVKGNIIIDDTAFDHMSMSPGASWDDQHFCWSAPIDAIIVEHNCVNITVIAAKEAMGPATLVAPEYPQSMRFVNHVITQPPTIPECTITAVPIDERTYSVNGCIKLSDPPQHISMAVHTARENIQFLLTYLFKKNHIQYDKILFDNVLPSSQLIAQETSPPLPALIITMLKESDNVIANALFKTVGALYSHKPGSFENGNKAIHAILLRTLGMKMPKVTLVDGAGVSRYNFLTPHQLVTLLQKIYVSRYSATFIAALPIGGVDGTLIDRMQEPMSKGKIYAKTGTMTAVTTLSGYLKTNKKKTGVFSIMINGFIHPPEQYKALEDSICREMIENN